MKYRDRWRLSANMQNSNLVLQREGGGPRENEPTGEPESLVGRLKHKMGDRVPKEIPKELKDKMEKKRARDEEKAKKKATKRTKLVRTEFGTQTRRSFPT